MDGTTQATGAILIDADGSLSLSGQTNVSGLGFSASISGFGGNVDPEIVFGLGATNSSSLPVAFAFAFSVPIGGLPAPLDTEGALSMILTAGSLAEGHLVPIGAKVMDSSDVVLTPFSETDKGVDLGDAFDDLAGGPATTTNELVTGSILAGGPFDVMTVVIAFQIYDDDQFVGSPGNVGVGMSGRVTQTPVPEPPLMVLLTAGLALLGLVSRRTR